MSTPQLRYQVVTSTSPDELAVLVSNFLLQGWKLQGDLIIVLIPGESLSILYVRELVR